MADRSKANFKKIFVFTCKILWLVLGHKRQRKHFSKVKIAFLVKQYNFTATRLQSQKFKVALVFQLDTTLFKYLAKITKKYLFHVTCFESTSLLWHPNTLLKWHVFKIPYWNDRHHMVNKDNKTFLSQEID